MFGLEAMFFGACAVIGDSVFGTNDAPRQSGEQPEQPEQPDAPVTCLSCGAQKNEHGELPCGH